MLTVRVTVNVPGATYVFVPGFWALDVLPSPQSQSHDVIGQLGDVEVSVTFRRTGACMLFGDVVYVNPALGGPQVGAGVGAGVGVGDELGEGVGDGLAVAEVTPVGSASSWVVAVDENVSVCPPSSGAMNGMRRVSRPVTVTLTRWPRVLEQSGVHASEMSDG